MASENHTLVYWIGAYTALSFISCLFGTLRYGTILLLQVFTLFLAEAFEFKGMSSWLLFGRLEYSSTTYSTWFFGHLSGMPFLIPQDVHQILTREKMAGYCT